MGGLQGGSEEARGTLEKRTRKNEVSDLDYAGHVGTLLEDIQLVHNALPELDYADVDTSTTFLGRGFKVPLLIGSRLDNSGRWEEALSTLSSVAEERGVGVSVSSQNRSLPREELVAFYTAVRKSAASVFLAAEFEAVGLSRGLGFEDARTLVDSIGADALILRLNPLRELTRGEDQPRLRGVFEAISNLSKSKTPIIVGEVGSGISREVAVRVEMAGAAAIEVAGFGGSEWRDVEEPGLALFRDWGIPTAATLIETKRVVKIPVVASGGLRNGIDVAKCLTLGANLARKDFQVMHSQPTSKEALMSSVDRMIRELKTTMLLTGAKDISRIAAVRKVVKGRLADWLR